ncbi:hypothetical protein CGRA01v4_08879 [Colletotrichum graminicola]|nr:hypothetical protein CGRA01v4_08879 [Colletotrichum graminicola]
MIDSTLRIPQFTMNGSQQAQETAAQQPLQPPAASANANANVDSSNASASANGNSSTTVKKRKKDGLKPIITTETPPAPRFHLHRSLFSFHSLHCSHHYPSILFKSAAPDAARPSLRSWRGATWGTAMGSPHPTKPDHFRLVKSGKPSPSPNWHCRSGSRGQSVPNTAPRSLSHSRPFASLHREGPRSKTLRHGSNEGETGRPW